MHDVRRRWFVTFGLALAAADFAGQALTPRPLRPTMTGVRVVPAPSGLTSDRYLELSFSGGARPSALLVVDDEGRSLAAAFWLPPSTGARGLVVPERALRPHAGSTRGVLLTGAAASVRAVLDRWTDEGMGQRWMPKARARALAVLRGVDVQWLALEAHPPSRFDPAILDDAERQLAAGDPGGALARLDAARGTVPAERAAEADAIAADAALAYGRAYLARSLSDRALGELTDGRPLLRARLLRTNILAFTESVVVTEAPEARTDLAKTAPLRTAPIEALRDAVVDLRLAELHDRRTPDDPRVPAAARQVLDRAEAVPEDELTALAGSFCRAGSHVTSTDAPRGRAALARGTSLARAAGRTADEAFCAIREGDLAFGLGDLGGADAAYARALAILGDKPLPREQREAWFSAALVADARGDHARAADLTRKACAWVDVLLDTETDVGAREAVFNNTLGYYVEVERFAIRAGDARGAIIAGESGKARTFGALLAGVGHLDESALGAFLRRDAGPALPAPRDLSNLARWLGPGDAAIAYTQLGFNARGRFELAIGVVTRDGEEARIVEQPPDLPTQVEALERAVARNDTAEARALGERLYPMFIGPIEDRLAGRSRLFVSPHLGLHALPLAALHDGTRFLAERFAIARVPPLVLDRRGPEDDRSALAEERRWLIAESAEHPPLPSLPGIEELTTDLEAQIRPTTTLHGVTPERLLQGLAGVDSLLYAGHARFDVDRPLRSALLVAPGEQGAEVPAATLAERDYRLHAVMLVGCETARQWDTKSYGDETIGLSRAFLAAGARHVVGALWPVIDRDAEDFVRAFFSQPTDLDVVRAVGATQACMAGGRCHARGIASWASFVVDAR